MSHVTFIHGIANKPEADKLRGLWLRSLSGNILGNGDGLNLVNLGTSASLIYWADILYEKCIPEDSAFESNVGYESIENQALNKLNEPDMSFREEATGEEKEMIESLASKLKIDLMIDDDETPPESQIAQQLERIPLPWFAKKLIMKILLKDVHHYLFNVKYSPRVNESFMVQEEIRKRVIEKLKEGAEKEGPHIVVSHSMGTLIAYDCLKRVKECPEIDGLITIGSPLGIDEIQDKLSPEWTRENGFPEKVRGKWINIYDKYDPVAGFDGNISNDFKKNGKEVIKDINEQNEGKWRHNITNYLNRPLFRSELKDLLDI